MRSEWKVSLALSLTLRRRSALRALNAPMPRDTAPSLPNMAAMFTQSVTSTMASIMPQMLRK